MGVPPVAETRAALLDAWRSWDEACATLADEGERHRVQHGYRGRLEGVSAALEVAYGNHAAHFGLRTTPFRDICAAWRRAGYDRPHALAAVEAGAQAARELPAPNIRILGDSIETF